MIDYYLRDKSLNTENKINECLTYYEGLDMSYETIYDKYDRIKSKKPVIHRLDDNIFFKGGRLKKIDTKFMKECLLESLKRLVDTMMTRDINDRDSELNSDISTYMNGSKFKANHFYNYPDIYEDDLPDKLYQREELRRHIIPPESGDIKDKCDSKYFELSPHQLFLKNLISPNTHYYGLLIFHGVGVGKSCSGVSIAENFRDIYGKEENKIIILASQNIRIGWKSTIFNPTKGDNQCTGNSYYHDDTDNEDVDIDDKYAKKQVKKYYELFGYAAFANSVKKMLAFGTKHLSSEEAIFNLKIKLIKDKFSNRVLIIDEVHNIRSDEKSIEDRDTIQYIEMVIKYSDKLRLILLTANPMYNINTEIVWILNMLLMNDNRNTVSEKDLFNKNGDIINIDKLNEISRGYVSYLRGENPVSFPVRLYPTHNKEKIIKHNVPGRDNRPALDVFGKTISEENQLSFLELYGSKLMGRQGTIYTKEVSKYEGLDSLQIDIENKLLQLSNIVFPGESEDCNDLYGENGLMNTMNINKNVYSYKDDKYGDFFRRDLIGDYSAKIADILDTIEKSDGICFIYSNWIKSGLVPLVLALEQNGYTNVSGKEILKNSKKENKISYEGKFIDEYEDKKDFIPANYLVISGSDLKSNNLEEELKILTSDENQNGQKIKVVVGSSVAAEGLDFKNIRSIHILEPWHNINKLEQVIGRGIRNCSHKKLASEFRNVTIYLHTSVTGDKEKESIDTYLYRYSESKAKQIGEIENILKKNSIDKYFFQNGNMYGKQDIDDIIVKPAYRESKSYKHDRSDKKYSRVCSFSEICNYMEDDVPNTGYKIPDHNKYDTYQIRYSASIIEIYKKRIHNLFSKSVCYTFDEITKNFNEYKDNYSDILNHAIKEMISDKYLLHNYNGDKGYLIRCDKFYLFQPYYNNDILLPTYYRINSGNTTKINYEFLERDKSKNRFLTEKHEFTRERILESYQNLINFKYSKLPNKYKPLDVGPGHEERIFDMLSVTNSITLAYRFDRLDIDDKLVLCTTILTALIYGDIYSEIDQNIIDDLIVVIEKLFIYYDGTKFYYRGIYEEKEKDFLVGFFLFNNDDKKPIFYNYHERTIEPYNKVDEIDIVRMIKKYQSDKILSPKGSWGFTTYYKRIKYSDPIFTHNGIVLKVIKSTDKLKKNYVYPNGPGIVIQDQGASGEWNSQLTLEFIKSEYPERYGSLSTTDKTFMEQCGEKGRKKDGSKRYLVCFIECLLRENGNLLQNDLIFVKYY
jgi:hypothetical protein